MRAPDRGVCHPRPRQTPLESLSAFNRPPVFGIRCYVPATWDSAGRSGPAGIIIDRQHGTVGMHEAEEAIATLERLEEQGMAQVSDGAALDVFFASQGVDPETLLIGAWHARYMNPSLRQRGTAVEHVLDLHAPGARRKGGETPARLAEWLASVESDLGPCAGLSAYLADRAKALGAVRVRLVLSDPARLLDALEGARLHLDAHEVRADCLSPVPLDDILACLQGDGLSLHAFRASLVSGVEILDQAIDDDWARFRDGVATGLLGLFDRRPGFLTPVEYLAAFPRAADDPDLLHRVLTVFARHTECRDSFAGAGPDEWLSALETFRCWAKVDLWRLACMGDLLAARPATYLATLSTAVRDGWERDRPMAVFAALTLVRGARCVSAVNRKLEDQSREQDCRSFLATLEGGEALLCLADLCRDLPLGLRGERHVWSGLADRIKEHWIRRVPAVSRPAGGTSCSHPEEVIDGNRMDACVELTSEAGRSCSVALHRSARSWFELSERRVAPAQ